MEDKQQAKPPGWGDDELSAFLEQAHRNQLGTFHNKKTAFALLREIDACFVKPVSGMINPRDLISPFLYMRSHSAWRAACGTAMAGQVVETFPHLRLALESAAYALFIHEKQDMREVWFNRNDSEPAKKRMRSEFSLTNISEAIARRDSKLASIFRHLYEQSIDQGGHPNQLGVMGSAAMTDIEGGKQLQQIYLHGDGIALDAALKVVVETGICCLYVLQNIPTFTARFQLLGIKDRLNSLRRKSSLLVKQTA